MADTKTVDSTGKLLDEVNRVNLPVKPLNLINVSLDPAEVDETDLHNTKVTIHGVPGRIYKGSVDVYYKRINLEEVLTGGNIRSTEPFTVDSIISMINRQYGLFLTADDFEPFTPPTPTLDQPQVLTLTAKSTSMGFIKSATLNFLYGRTLLESVVTIRVFPVLNHPADPALGLTSSRMTTWGFDFTSLRDSLAVNKTTNSFTDFPTFLAACLEVGFPKWEKGTLVDSGTADVPDSNPLFDRVVVQAAIGESLMTGPLYFHYNLLDGV